VDSAHSQRAGSLARYFTGDAGSVEHWPAERLRDYHRDAIAEQLAHVAAGSPFYRAKFAAAGVSAADFLELADLARFPFTAKSELLADPWTLLSVPREQVALVHTSTGTTGGDWSYLLYTWDDMHGHDTIPAPRVLMPVRPGDVVINALPYEMSSSGQSFQRSLQGGFSATVVPVGKGGFYSDPDKTIRIMGDLRADVLVTTPPYAMLLTEAAAARGIRIGTDLKPRFLWITGEGCSPAYRRRLEELWGCPALVFYGSMECGSMAIECPQRAGCHVSLGQVYVEIIDPKTGQPSPPGQVGEVVCTVLQRKASPLIRFRTHDLGFLDEAPCACGVRFPRLHIRGRMADQIAGGGQEAPPISPYLVEDVLYARAEMGNNYQIYVDGGRLLVEAELRPGSSDADGAVRAAIETGLAQRGLQAELRWIDHIPRTGGKTRRVRPLTDRDLVMSPRS
jgi:phenylacetate-CoA ligase